MLIVSPQWKTRIQEKLACRQRIDETLTHNKAAAWLIAELADRGFPFRVYNLGAGVKRVTTDTDVCPCCRKPL